MCCCPALFQTSHAFIVGGCGDTAALLGSALSEIGSKSSLIGISSYGSSGLTNRSDVQSLESPVEIYIDRHEYTQTKPSNEPSNTPLDLHHPFHISVGGSRSQNGAQRTLFSFDALYSSY